MIWAALACTAPSQDSGEIVDSQPDTATPPEGWFEDCPREEREQRHIELSTGATLNVACRGSGDTTVVFLHGFPEWHYSWDAVMDELVDEYRLIAPDQRGYNTSTKFEDLAEYELPRLREDIVELLPRVSEDPVILVAHDWGGPVGWSVAHDPDAHVRGFMAANGPHPQRFADLIANDPDQREASSYMDFFRSEGSEDTLTPDVLSTWFPFLSDEELVLYKEAWGQPGAVKGGLDWYRANDLSPESMGAAMEGLSPTIDRPVSVLWGLDDDAVLPQNAEGLEIYASDLEVQTFEGVDHWIEHRIPQDVAQAIRELEQRSR